MRVRSILLTLLITIAVFAKDKKNTVEFKGMAEIGVHTIIEEGVEDKYRTVDLERIGIVELGSDIKAADNIGVRFKIEYDNSYHTIKLKKLYGRYKWEKNDLRFGYMKKQFGFEESCSSADLPFNKRSVINDYLASFNILGHDLSVQYGYKSGPKERLNKIFVNTAVDGTGRVFGTITGELVRDRWTFHGSMMYANSAAAPEKGQSLFGNIGIRHTTPLLKNELEVTGGPNPELRHLEQENGGDDRIYFGGVRFLQEFSHPIDRKLLKKINPLWEASFVDGDLRDPQSIVQLRPGLTFKFGKGEVMQFRTSADFRFSSEGQESRIPSLYQTGIISEVVIVW